MFGSSSATRIFLLMRQSKRETGAGSQAALDPQAAAEMLDDVAADVQAEAAAVGLGGQRIADLAKFVEDHFLVGRIDAGAVVAHVDAQRAGLLRQRDLD